MLLPVLNSLGSVWVLPFAGGQNNRASTDDPPVGMIFENDSDYAVSFRDDPKPRGLLISSRFATRADRTVLAHQDGIPLPESGIALSSTRRVSRVMRSQRRKSRRFAYRATRQSKKCAAPPTCMPSSSNARVVGVIPSMRWESRSSG